jgi:hypothetical protein
MVARLCINGSSRTAAADTSGSRDTGMLILLGFPLLADIPNGKRRDRLPERVVRCRTPRDTDAGAAGAAGSALPACQET